MAHLMRKIGRLFGADLDPHDAAGRRFLGILVLTAAIAGALVTVLSPWKAFAIAVSFVVAGFAFYRPEAILLFLVVYTPLEPFLLKFVSDDIYVYARYFSEGLIYVLLASVAFRVIFRERKMVATPIDLPFVFFMLVAVASLILNVVSPVVGVLGLRQIIRFILVFFLTVYLAPDDKFIKLVTKVMFGVVLFEGALGLLQAIVGGPLDEFLIPSEVRFYDSIQLTAGTSQFWSPGTRVFATMGRFDQLGTFLAFFFLIGTGLLYYLKSKEAKRALLFVILAAFPAFILTLSRASWFGWLIGFLLVGAVFMKDARIRLGFVALIAAALLYVGYTGIKVSYLTDYPQQTVVERFFEAFSYERWRGEYYGLGRLYWIVQTPLVVVRSSPLFGVGPGQYGGGAAAALGNTTVYEKLNLPFGVYGTDGYIDNNWFSLWGETGTLGLLFYVWMFVALFRMAVLAWKEAIDPYLRGLALGYAGCVVAVAFQAFLATYLEVRTLALYLWLFGAFIYVMARREKIYA